MIGLKKMSYNINNNKKDPKPNPKNEGLLNKNIEKTKKLPKIYNFFFTKNYEKLTSKKFNFVERNLLKLPYGKRFLTSSLFNMTAIVAISSYVTYLAFNGPRLPINGYIPSRINKKKKSAFLILEDHPYPYKYEDDE